MENKEYIIFAAMKKAGTDKEVSFENKNFRVGFSHGDILNANMYSQIKVGYNSDDYGFMTNTGRFVSRKEAADIARDAGQLYEVYNKTINLNSYELDIVAASEKFKQENYELWIKLRYFDGDEE